MMNKETIGNLHRKKLSEIVLKEKKNTRFKKKNSKFIHQKRLF